MDTAIFFFTGTGNSLWAARTLAGELGRAEWIPLAAWKREKRGLDAKTIGLVFPVHIWGVPRRVLDFVGELKTLRPDYLFAIAVNAGQVANTLVQLKSVLRESGLNLSAGFEIAMPSNYIPWGGPGPRERQERRFAAARKKLAGIAAAIQGKKELPVEKGPFWQRILFSFFYRMTFAQVPKMDRKFWADEKCNRCSICSKICPSGNIALREGKPAWNRRCEQCFACLQWCPQQAIQYGRKTPRYERYQHPEVGLNEVLQTGRAPR
jgi:Pyruvate/2-oxoacid:ferredoxin oxidoreductase delta subunit